MIMRRFFLTALIILTGFYTFSQSQKTITKENIRTKTIKEYDYSSGKEKSYIVEVTKYDERGNEIENLEYEEENKLS